MFINKIIISNSLFFDKLEKIWNNNKTQKIIWTLILLSFVFFGFAIEINKIFLNTYFDLPTELFFSIVFVFNLILFYEMIDLVFAVSKSFSIAISKQIEILSLVLLRDSFKLVSSVSDEKLYGDISNNYNFIELINTFFSSNLFIMILSITGAIIVFAVNIKFKENYKKFDEISESDELNNFIRIKKIISLVHIFVVLIFLFWIFFDERTDIDKTTNLLSLFFLSLIYVDILHLLVSYYFSKDYHLVFRNSSYSANTLLIRYSISASPILGVITGVTASILLLLTIIIFNHNISHMDD
tara:strand:- start:468 stop:1361 length:894 start_codon:yes stop_codon:yes gene_type:complete